MSLVEQLLNPISETNPCGEDLEALGNIEFNRNFLVRIEGLMPSSYFTFSPETIKFAEEFKRINYF